METKSLSAMRDHTKEHQIRLNNRKELHLTGVQEVIRFDDNSVLLATAAGNLSVKGSNLKMGNLSLENGELKLSGQIDAISYSGAEEKGFRKWFR